LTNYFKLILNHDFKSFDLTSYPTLILTIVAGKYKL